MTKTTPSGIKALQSIEAELIEARRASSGDLYKHLTEVSFDVVRAFMKNTPTARRKAYKQAQDAIALAKQENQR